MSTIVRDAGAMLSAPHRRAAEHKAQSLKASAGVRMVTRLAIVAAVVLGLIASVNAVMLTVLS